MKNKKAQIGETLTWFIAFIIIFFIIIIFTIVTIALSLKNVEENIEKLKTESLNYEKIISILNLKVNYKSEELVFKDLIKEYYSSDKLDEDKKRFIENTLKENLKEYNYKIEIKKGEEDNKKIYLESSLPYRGSGYYYSKVEYPDLEKKNEIYIIGKEKIKISFYLKNEK
ncbi:MAG: hypothetical protein QW117_01030 [Candidatus Pacearchaeota archaeon]